jgi:hypothetical protein
LPQQRKLGIALGRVLRRWADAIAPEEEKLQAAGAERHKVAVPDKALPPAASVNPVQSKARMPGQPPQHWLELVRRAARGPMATYWATPPPDRSRPATEDSAAPAPPTAQSAACGPRNGQAPEKVRETELPAGSFQPHHSAASASISGEQSGVGTSIFPLQPFGEKTADSRRAGEAKPASGQSSQSPRSNPRLPDARSDLRHPIVSQRENAIASVNSIQFQDADTSLRSQSGEESVTEKLPKFAVPELGGRVWSGSESRVWCSARNPAAHRGLAAATKHVETDPRPLGGEGVPRSGTGEGVLAEKLARKTRNHDLAAEAADPMPRQVPHQLPSFRMAEVSAEFWPELPEDPSRSARKQPSAATSRPETPALSSGERSSPKRNEGRWPELLEKPPSTDDDWAEALRNQERLHQLEAEQRGGEGWSA